MCSQRTDSERCKEAIESIDSDMKGVTNASDVKPEEQRMIGAIGWQSRLWPLDWWPVVSIARFATRLVIDVGMDCHRLRSIVCDISFIHQIDPNLEHRTQSTVRWALSTDMWLPSHDCATDVSLPTAHWAQSAYYDRRYSTHCSQHDCTTASLMPFHTTLYASAIPLIPVIPVLQLFC